MLQPIADIRELAGVTEGKPLLLILPIYLITILVLTKQTQNFPFQKRRNQMVVFSSPFLLYENVPLSIT